MNAIRLKRTNSTDDDFRMLVGELDADLRLRNGGVMDIYDQHNIIPVIDTVVIAYLDNKPAGCGCFKNFSTDTVEIKRMFVRPLARGNKVSSMVLNELEAWSKSTGFTYAVLETGEKQVEALGLYQKSGYNLISKYEPYVDLPDSICFCKLL